MFTAHISGWSKKELLSCPATELRKWHNEALKLHNYLNTPEENSGNGNNQTN